MLYDVHHGITKPVSPPRTLNFFYHDQYQTKDSALRVQKYLPFSTATPDPYSLILVVNHTFIIGNDHTAIRDTTGTICSILSTFESQHAFFAILRASMPALLPGYVRFNVGPEGPPIRRVA